MTCSRYDPKQGSPITQPTRVTGANTRVYYRPPPTNYENYGKWASFNYRVSDSSATSAQGLVTIVPPSGIIVGSDFFLDRDSWTIVGNKNPQNAQYDKTTRGAVSFFIFGTDDVINAPAREPHGSGM